MRSPRTVSLFAAVAIALPAAAAAQRTVELPARDRLIRDVPAQVWAVGTDEGESWEMFAGVTRLAFDRDDNLHVLDQGNARVLVFDAQGRFVRQFGKQGGGPGEFQAPASISLTHDGRIAVYDMMRRGFSMFDGRGSYIEHVTAPDHYGTPRTNELYAHPQGGIVARAMPAIGLQSIPSGNDSIASPIYHAMLAEDGTARTLYEFMLPPPKIETRDAGSGRQMRMISFSRPTFAVEPSWGVLPDGRLVISRDPDYSLLVTDPGGEPRSALTRPLRARQVTRRDQDDAREQRRRQLRDGDTGPSVRVSSTGPGGGTAFFRSGGTASIGGEPMSAEQIEEAVAQMQFAEVIPAIQRVAVDPTGRIWVRRSPERVGQDEPIDLLTADGRYIGTVTGQEIPLAVSASGLAAYVEKNELDIEHVVVRRLPDSWK